MIRVLSVVQHAVFGGPQNRNLRLAPLLEARGIHLTVALPDEDGDAADRLRAGGVETIQTPLHRVRGTLRPSFHAKYISRFSGDVHRMRELVRERKIDVVQINGLLVLQPAVVAIRERLPIVWQLLDVGHPLIVRLLTMPLVVRRADVLMSNGMGTARGHPGAMSFADRLITFFPPVDLNVFKPDPRVRAAARQELGFAPEDFVIGTVGNINPQKDHVSFVRAAGALKRRFPITRFVILGATLPHRLALAARVRREGAAQGLELDRDLVVKNPGSRVCELAQAFDLFWLTSRQEGTVTAVQEAMALGIPVVSMDAGSVSETVEHGWTGFIVPGRDRLALVRATIRLMQNPRLRAEMGEKARDSAARRFDANICADAHVRAYKQAIANRCARATA